MAATVAALPEVDPAMIDSDQEYVSEPSTPGTPVSAAPSPKKAPKGSRIKYLSCPYDGCEKMFNRPARLEEHKRSHTNERIFKCTEPGCDKDFLRKTHRDRHVESAHWTGPRTYKCRYEDCDMSFTTNQRLKRHHEVHEKRDKYRCTEPGCEQTFRKHSTRDQHIRTVHRGEAAYPCDEILEDGSLCPKHYTNASALLVHKGRDHGAKRYFCTICPDGPDIAFGTFSDLQAHNKTVHPPICETCGFVTTTNKQLASHIEKKHGDSLTSRQTHICTFPECNGQGFVSNKNLQEHIRSVHEDKRPFKCGDTSLQLNHVEGWDIKTACGRAFHVKATLENHIRVRHMGLETTMKSSLKRKAERLQAAAERESQQTKRRNGPATKLELLTGTSMTGNIRRTIPCSVQGCNFVFMREWDKQVHLQARHGIALEDNWIMTSDMHDDQDGEEEPEFDEAFQDEDADASDLSAAQLLGTRPVRQSNFLFGTTEEELEESARLGGQFWLGGSNDQQNIVRFDPLIDGYGISAGESDAEE